MLNGGFSGARQAESVRIFDSKGRKVPLTLGASREYATGVTAPWAGWSTSVQESDGLQSWTLKLPGGLSSSGQEVGATQFEVALVVGDDDAALWPASPGEVQAMRLAGKGLSWLAVATVAATAAVLALAALGLPAPARAVLPPLSSASVALQFLALLGPCGHAPGLLRGFCSPLAWVAPSMPSQGLWHAAAILLVVAGSHAATVFRYLVLNGSGSASALPHGLAFGARALRALPFAVLPLAATGASAFAGAGAWYVPAALLGAGLLAALVAAALGPLQRVRGWLAEERVVPVPMPGGDEPIFVDRICDQIRASPVAPGHVGLLGDWTASVGWCAAPAVAAVRDLEHRGGTKDLQSMLWPAGPWAQHRGGDPEAVKQPTQPPSPGNVKRLNRMSSRASSALGFYKELTSPVFGEHPIRAAVEFAYAGCARPCVAGVVGLPWVDVAVPADSMRRIEAMVASFALQVHVGQLSGPLTGGRLAACFEWGNQRPWRWSADMLVRLILGAYVGALASVGDSEVTSAVVMHGVAIGVAALAVGALAVKPYVHLVDNVSLAAALLAVAAGLAALSLSKPLPSAVPAALTVLAALAVVPLVLALTAAVLVVAFAVRLRHGGLHDEVLPAAVRGWACSSPPTGDGYLGVCCGEGLGAGASKDNNAFAFGHSADVVPLSLREGLGSAKVRIHLPAELRISVVHQELRGHVSQRGPSPVCTRRTQVPIPAGLLFTPSRDGLDRAAAQPFAALLTPQGGQLLYSEKAFNGGISWVEVVRCFFQDDKDLAKEAERIIQEHEREVPAEAGDGLLAVLEYDGPMASTDLRPSWKTCK